MTRACKRASLAAGATAASGCTISSVAEVSFPGRKSTCVWVGGCIADHSSANTPPHTLTMPHKHTRKPNAAKDESHFNLAPTSRAAPLPAFSKSRKDAKLQQQQQQQQSRKDGKAPKAAKKAVATTYKQDDTPRAFARMMQFHATGKRPDGLDDGERPAKKRKVAPASTKKVGEAVAPAPEAVEMPKILPGERLADYAARVDQALPVGNLVRRGKGPQIDGLKERVTKTEKRLKKMYAAWREEETRLREKEEEAAELEEEAEEERRAMYGEDYKGLESMSRKKRKVLGESKDDDEDPWAVIKTRRAEAEAEAAAEEAKGKKRGGLKGVHDVVQAPPTIKVVPKEKFKVKNGAKVDVANVPTSAGSLKRREELSDARREVIERYRAMMKGEGRGL